MEVDNDLDGRDIGGTLALRSHVFCLKINKLI